MNRGTSGRGARGRRGNRGRRGARGGIRRGAGIYYSNYEIPPQIRKRYVGQHMSKQLIS